MEKVIFFTTLLAVSLAHPAQPGNIPPSQPEHSQRETKFDVRDPATIYLQHRETLLNKGPHLVDGTAEISKNFAQSKDPLRTLGKVEYNYLPSNSAFNVQAENAGRFGTKVTAEGLYHLYKDRTSAVDLGANYGQNFGGPFGKSQPSVNAFIRGTF